MNDIVFKFEFTPAVPCECWSAEKKAKWARERAFYTCQADFDYLNYILNKNKTNTDNDALLGRIDVQEDRALAEDLNQKTFDRHEAKSIDAYMSRGGNLGIFDLNGDMTPKQLEAYHNGAKETGSIIWHGWISFDMTTSKGFQYDEAKKFMKQTFGGFLKKNGFASDNLAMICALHTDKEHHHHIHYSFYEQAPKYRDKNGNVGYRNYGVINQKKLADYKISAAAYMDENRDEYYTRRDRALDQLRRLKREPLTNQELTQKLVELARVLPQKGRLQYNGKDMEPYRKAIDEVALCFLCSNPAAWNAHKEVMQEIARKEKEIRQLPGGESSSYIKELNNEYKSRLGNQILGMVKQLRFDPKRLDKAGRMKRGAALTDRQKKAVSRRRYQIGARVVERFMKALDNYQAYVRTDFTKDLERAEYEVDVQQKRRRSS